MGVSRKAKDGPPHVTEMGVSEFKARCLEVLERVRRRGEDLVITKRGTPIARVSPIRRGSARLRGAMKDEIVVRGGIVSVDWTDEWESAR